MKSSLKKQAERFLREQKNYKRWLAVFVCLAVVVTIGTTAALKYKGIAVTSDDSATEAMHMDQTEGNTEEIPEGMRKHVHTEACYEEQLVLVCGAAKAEAGETADAGAADTETSDAGTADSGASDTGAAPEESEPADASQGHTHSDDCYEVTGGMEKLTCTIEEHTHGDKCYETKMVTETVTKTVPETVTEEVRNEDGSVSTVEKTVDKTVEETVEKEEKVLTCTKEEHTHDASCYTVEGGERTLVCGKEEGEGAEVPKAVEKVSAETKTPAAAETTAEAVSAEAKAPVAKETDAAPAENADAAEETAGEHVHTDACYELQKVLICGKEEGELEEIPVEGFAAGTLVAEGEDYEIIVSYGPEAEIPSNAELSVRELEADSDEYKECYAQMMEALAAEEATESAEIEENAEVEESAEGDENEAPEVTFARFFDIKILVDGEEREPSAEVTVQINYDEEVMNEEDQTGHAVHFPKEGDTELIEAGIKDGKEFEFNQSGFSITGTYALKVPDQGGILVAEGDDYRITVSYGKDVNMPAEATLKATEVRQNDDSYYNYLDSGESAVIEKKSNESEESEEDNIPETVFARFFEISVEDANGNGVNITDDVKVSVDYDATTAAEEGGVAAMVLADEDNSEVLGELKGVSGGEEVTNFAANGMLRAGNMNVGTMMMSSAVPVNYAAGRANTGRHDDVKGYLKTTGKNDWQIVENGYAGNGVDNKITSDDQKVRIQKNVIPTDVENEFYVYLSMDVKTTVSEQIDLSGFAAKTNNAAAPGAIVPDSQVVTGIVIKGTEKKTTITLRDPQNNIIEGFDHVNLTWNNSNNFTLTYRAGGKYYSIKNSVKEGIHQDVKLPQVVYDEIMKTRSETSILKTVTDVMGENITFVEGAFVDSAGNKYDVWGDYNPDNTRIDGRTLTWTPMVNPGCETDPANVEDIKNGEFWTLNAAQLVYKVRLDVTADRFQSCAEHIGADGSVCKNCNLSSADTPGHRNAVNTKATLTYGKDGETPSSIEFQVPTVRGLRYDIPLKKVDEDTIDSDNPTVLKGAEFELRKTNKEITDENGIPYGPIKGTTDKDGIIRFKDLPWGTYEVWETESPEGYKAVPKDGKKVGEVTVCYTTKPDDVKQEVVTQPDGSQKILPNMIASKVEEIVPTVDENGNTTGAERKELKKDKKDGISFLIKNEKIPPIKLVKEWDDEENVRDLRPDEVTFRVEYHNSTEGYKFISQYEDADGNITYTTDTGKEGGEANGRVTLKVDESWEKILYGLPESEKYRVTEVLPEDSAYQTVETITVKETEVAEGITEKIYGTDTGATGKAVTEVTNPKNAKKKIKCYTITNELKKRNLTFIKVDEDTMGSGNDPQTPSGLAGAEFSLWIKTKDNYADETPKISPLENNMLISNENGIITNANFNGELKYGEYWLEETKAPANYVKPKEPYVLKVDAAGIKLFYEGKEAGIVSGPDANGNYEIQVPNKSENKKVQIWKIETGTSTVSGNELEGAKYLEGAKFDVYYTESLDADLTWPEDVEDKDIQHWKSGEDGLIVDGSGNAIKELKIGSYLIKETEAPDGYNRLDGEIRMTVTSNGVSCDSVVVKKSEDGSFKIYIPNSAGLILPEAGGPGTAAYTFGGLAMIIAVSLMYGLNMRRKREKGGLM